MGYLLLVSMFMVAVMGQSNISHTQKDLCRNVNYQVNHLHQTNHCCNNGSGNSMAIEDLKAQLAFVQARLQILEDISNKTGPSGSCPPRFTARHNSSCYHFIPEEVDWITAYLKCSTTGTKLVSIESQEENAYLRNYIKKTRHLTTGDFWISGTDLEEEGIWFWAGSDKFMTFSAWNPGEPNEPTITVNQDCLLLYKATGWTWHDAPCAWKRGYICEMSL